jgi:hypothetical protein
LAAAAVEFNGWFLTTPSGDPAADPVDYEVHASVDVC